MGTRAEDDRLRQEYQRLSEEVKRRIAEKTAAARRTRLHYFGLAGGRR